jgi:hypothetical protein
MPRKRDGNSTYQGRIARGLAKGLSRSQARGHPRAGERHTSAKAAERKPDRKLLEGLKALRETGSLTKASQKAKVAPERLRHFVQRLDFVERRGRRYSVGEDPWWRRVIFYSGGHKVDTVVQGYEPARLAGLYWEAVSEFRQTNDPAFLAPFQGVQIKDVNDNTYTFETRPNVVYRLANEGLSSFEQVYQIVV